MKDRYHTFLQQKGDPLQSVRVPTNNYLIHSGLKEFSKRMLKWFNIGFQLAPRIYKSIQTEKQANKIYEKDTLESKLILGHVLFFDDRSVILTGKALRTTSHANKTKQNKKKQARNKVKNISFPDNHIRSINGRALYLLP